MTFDFDDVIAAPASAPGPAARTIIRVSGAEAPDAVRTIFEPDEGGRTKSRIATRSPGRLILTDLGVSLPAAAYLWPTRRSYTGEPLVELHLPGSPPLVEATLAAVYTRGVRPARPGEFTLRAFLAGRLDLVRAEAVLGVIDAADHRELDLALRQLAGGLSGRLADVRADLLSLLADLEAGLDFVDEDIEFVSRAEVLRRAGDAARSLDDLLAATSGRWRDAGRSRVVLVGLPNAGKSTLFNALVGGGAALVSPVPGTTRDWLAVELTFDGTPIELIDTAGWETAADDLSAAMQSLRAQQLDRADLILWCTAADTSVDNRRENARLHEQLGPLRERVIDVLTKADLLNLDDTSEGRAQRPVPLLVSAATDIGLPALRSRVAAELTVERSGARQMIGSTAARGRESLSAARDALARMEAAAESGFGDEVLGAELRLALDSLAAVLGVVYTDDVLDLIFSRFCIGK